MNDVPTPLVAGDRATIREAVKANLTETLPGRTRELVIEHFAKQEAEEQGTALIKGLDKLSSLERDLNQINRPDVKTFNEDGSEASATWSKDRLDERKKLSEQIEKLSKAIDKPDDKGDFADLYNLTK